jgi:hypothetical protein
VGSTPHNTNQTYSPRGRDLLEHKLKIGLSSIQPLRRTVRKKKTQNFFWFFSYAYGHMGLIIAKEDYDKKPHVCF